VIEESQPGGRLERLSSAHLELPSAAIRLIMHSLTSVTKRRRRCHCVKLDQLILGSGEGDNSDDKQTQFSARWKAQATHSAVLSEARPDL
jgi:hypothetical protein